MSSETQIKSTLKFEITGMTARSEVATLEVGAFDKVSVAVAPPVSPATSATTSVTVQPSAAAKVKFLLISADSYGDTLSYTVKKDSSNAPETVGVKDIALDGPQVLIGGGAVSLLGIDPVIIDFKNSDVSVGAAAVNVEVLVGRDAT